jgi:hypothetical protein
LNQAAIDYGIVNTIKRKIACEKQAKTSAELVEHYQGGSVELT